jgi:hypothetical protein
MVCMALTLPSDVTAEAGSAESEETTEPARETHSVGAKIPASRKANQIVRRLRKAVRACYTMALSRSNRPALDQATFQA